MIRQQFLGLFILYFIIKFIQFIINLTIPRRKNNSAIQLSPMEKDEIKIWGKNLKFASKTTMEFSVTGIHDPFFWFSGSAQAALCCCTVAVRHLPQQQEVAASEAEQKKIIGWRGWAMIL